MRSSVASARRRASAASVGGLLVAQREQGLAGDRLQQPAVGGGQRAALPDQVHVRLDGDVDVGLVGPGAVRRPGAGRHRATARRAAPAGPQWSGRRPRAPWSSSRGSGSGRVSTVREKDASSAASARAPRRLLGAPGGAVDHQRHQHGDQHHRHQRDHVLALGDGEACTAAG